MKRLTLAVSLLVLGVGVVFAGEWHTGANLKCSDCHTMHASLQHSYGGNTNPDNFGTFPQSWTPTTFLLKGEENSMCLACHNDGTAPDVLGLNTGPVNPNRSAGALNSALEVVDGYQAWYGHTLYSTDTAPGDTGSYEPDAVHGLTCTSCHHQHGYAGFNTVDVAGNPVSDIYRNLRAFDGQGISYAVTSNDLNKDVFEAGPMNYNADQVNLNEPNTADSGFGDWCQHCHVNFHGLVGDASSVGGDMNGEHFVRHPNAGVDIGALTGGHSSLGVFSNKLYRVRVMANGNWGTQGSAWTDAATYGPTPTCLSCHKAHGNARSFGLIYAEGTTALGENGDGTSARDLCRQCHVQGG